ncbi:MAG TPA: chalcone isomerase family protein [Rhodocyclaceae bacterium]|nr:chalcone isomerase family protein [Rhodocyclaceae bacterium]
MKRIITAALAALSLNLAYAVEVAGVKFDDKTKVGSADVIANGAGLRKKGFFKVYSMALYLPEKSADAEKVLGAKGAKRIAITLLRDLTGQTFIDALKEGIDKNHTDAELNALMDRIKQLSDTMIALGEVKSGTTVLIDWVPEKGMQLTVNGQVKGKEIKGEDFFKALLSVWLGKEPVQSDLKSALLGK